MYYINYRVKKPVLRGSFQDIGRKFFKFFSFKYENEDIHVNFNDYAGSGYFNEFTKESELTINTKQDFDSILEEILIFVKNKKEFHDLKKKLNSLPKKIQGNLFESLDVNVAHVSGSEFYDGVNGFEIGMFIHESFREKDCTLEEFKELIENLVIEAQTKDKSNNDWRNQYSFKDWRDQNTLKRNGKIYVPICRIKKIHYETPNAYRVYNDQWIPKSLSYMDDRYIYCEEWFYKKFFK